MRSIHEFRKRAYRSAPRAAAAVVEPQTAWRAAHAARAWLPPALAVSDDQMPSAAILAERWRLAIVQGVLDLRGRHPTFQRPDMERLLVRLTMDLEGTLPRPSVVLSIDDVLRGLGTNETQPVALIGMAESLVARASGALAPVARQVWSHMTRTGLIARTVARAFGVPEHDGFVLGLLHDVGKLVLCDVLGAMDAEQELPNGLVADALERLHEPLGGLVLLHWGVDPRSARAVATHHRTDRALGGGRTSEMLFLAERIELARTHHRGTTVTQWIADGKLTASPNKIAAVVDQASRML